MKNNQMTILKALGIILVVMGHVYSPFKLFPPYSFHMALFIFISGYFYNTKYEGNILGYIKKKFKSMIIPYFAYNLFYLIVNYYHFKYYQYIPADLFSFKRFFIMPFINGHQYLFFIPAWFVPALFIIQITFIVFHKYLSKFIKSPYVIFVLYLVLALLGIELAIRGKNQGIYLIIIRTSFGFFFYYLGLLYKTKLEAKNIFNFKNLALVLIMQLLIVYKYKSITYGLALGYFPKVRMLPIITSITGIYVYTYLSIILEKYLKYKKVLYIIGESTYSIMANHFFAFLLINLVFVKIKNIDAMNIVISEYFYNLNRYWPLYVILAIALPTLFSVFAKRVKITKGIFSKDDK